MCILNIHCKRPIVTVADTTSKFYLIDPTNRWSPRKYSKVKHQKAVWLKFFETILDLGNKATAANIRAFMNWGDNKSRNHCDYFSTMQAKGFIRKVYLTGQKAPIYQLTVSGYDAIPSADAFMKALDKANLTGTDRPEEQLRAKQRRAEVKAAKARIMKEAK